MEIGRLESAIIRGGLCYKYLADQVRTRTERQVRNFVNFNRARLENFKQLHEQSWSKDDEKHLASSLALHGAEDIPRIAKAFPGKPLALVKEKVNDSVRKRNNERPKKKYNAWTEEKENLIFYAMEKYGTNWKDVSSFTACTPAECKSWFDRNKNRLPKYIGPVPLDAEEAARLHREATEDVDKELRRVVCESTLDELANYDAHALMEETKARLGKSIINFCAALANPNRVVRNKTIGRMELKNSKLLGVHLPAIDTDTYNDRIEKEIVDLFRQQARNSTAHTTYIRLVKLISSMKEGRIRSGMHAEDCVHRDVFQNWMDERIKAAKPLHVDFQNGFGVGFSEDNLNYRMTSTANPTTCAMTTGFAWALPPERTLSNVRKEIDFDAHTQDAYFYMLSDAAILPERPITSIYASMSHTTLKCAGGTAVPMTQTQLAHQRMVRQFIDRGLLPFVNSDAHPPFGTLSIAGRRRRAILLKRAKRFLQKHGSLCKDPSIAARAVWGSNTRNTKRFLPSHFGIAQFDENKLSGMLNVLLNTMSRLSEEVIDFLKSDEAQNRSYGFISGDATTLKRLQSLFRHLLRQRTEGENIRHQATLISNILNKIQLVAGDLHTDMNALKNIFMINSLPNMHLAQRIGQRGIGANVVTAGYQRHTRFIETKFQALCFALIYDALEDDDFLDKVFPSTTLFDVEELGTWVIAKACNNDASPTMKYFLNQSLFLESAFLEKRQCSRNHDDAYKRVVFPRIFLPCCISNKLGTYRKVLTDMIEFDAFGDDRTKKWFADFRSVNAHDISGEHGMAMDEFQETIVQKTKKIIRSKQGNIANIEKIGELILVIDEIGRIGDALQLNRRRRTSPKPKIADWKVFAMMHCFRRSGVLTHAFQAPKVSCSSLRDVSSLKSNSAAARAESLLGATTKDGKIFHYQFFTDKDDSIHVAIDGSEGICWKPLEDVSILEKNKSPTCSICFRTIDIKQESIELLWGVAHRTCARCAVCDKVVGKKSKTTENGDVVCANNQCSKNATRLISLDEKNILLQNMALHMQQRRKSASVSHTAESLPNKVIVSKAKINAYDRGRECMVEKKYTVDRAVFLEDEKARVDTALRISKELDAAKLSTAASADLVSHQGNLKEMCNEFGIFFSKIENDIAKAAEKQRTLIKNKEFEAAASVSVEVLENIHRTEDEIMQDQKWGCGGMLSQEPIGCFEDAQLSQGDNDAYDI